MCASQYDTCSMQKLQQRAVSSTVITQRIETQLYVKHCAEWMCLDQNSKPTSKQSNCEKEVLFSPLLPQAHCGILQHFSLAVRLFCCRHTVLVESHPLFMMYNNSRAHCPLLQFLHTTNAIIADAHSYFVVSSFKCEGKMVAMT